MLSKSRRKRRHGLCRHAEALLGVLPADRRRPRYRAAPADACCAIRKATAGERARRNRCCRSRRPAACRRPRNLIARCAMRRLTGDRHRAQDASDASASRWCRRSARNRQRCSRLADVDPAIPVMFLDTGWLFEETLAYRDTLIAALGLRDVRSIKPHEAALVARGCGPRVVADRSRRLLPHPQGRAAGARAWRRSTAGSTAASAFRAATAPTIPVVEAEGARLKFNPVRQRLARGAQGSIHERANLPPHPLQAGFSSIGCMPCTTRTKPGEDPRAGRWRDRGKTECGIHTVKTS